MIGFGELINATASAYDTFKTELFGSDSGSGSGSGSTMTASTTSADTPDVSGSTGSGLSSRGDPLISDNSDTTDTPSAVSDETTVDASDSDASGDDDATSGVGSATYSTSEPDETAASASLSSSGAGILSGSSASASSGSSSSSSSSSSSASWSQASATSTPASVSPFESTQGISTSSSSSMSASSIAGIIVGTVGVLLVVAVFAFWRRRNQRESDATKPRALRSTGGSIANFKTLSSGRNGDAFPAEPNGCLTINMSSGSMDSMLSTSQAGLWNDPTLIAARIPMDLITMQELISRGGFGQVFSGTYRGDTVAVKTLLPDNRKNMNEISAFFAEIKIMAELDHPRIVRFLGVAWNSLSDVCCVSEFMVGGDLRSLLMHFQESDDPEQNRPHGFDTEKVQIALDVAHGLTYLHTLDPAIIHRDLKSRNVLLTSTLEAKLTDFGVSRHRSDGQMTCNVGTSLWMAPEVMMGRQYDERADVFSFGVMLSELDSHDLPYANVTSSTTGKRLAEPAILQMVAVGNLQVEFSQQCTAELRELGQACTALDPADRPSSSEVLYKLQLALRAFQEQEVSL